MAKPLAVVVFEAERLVRRGVTGTFLKCCSLCNNMALPMETCYDGSIGTQCPRYKAAIAKSPVEWVTIDP